MAKCITCGMRLHPERARKYSYCTAPACQQQNAKGLTMVAVGMNKAADELVILDEQAREDLASGKLRDQRRGSFGTSAAAPARAAQPPARAAQPPAPAAQPGGQAERPPRPRQPRPPPPPPRHPRPWSQRRGTP